MQLAQETVPSCEITYNVETPAHPIDLTPLVFGGALGLLIICGCIALVTAVRGHWRWHREATAAAERMVKAGVSPAGAQSAAWGEASSIQYHGAAVGTVGSAAVGTVGSNKVMASGDH
jgi:hypothetical protein